MGAVGSGLWPSPRPEVLRQEVYQGFLSTGDQRRTVALEGIGVSGLVVRLCGSASSDTRCGSCAPQELRPGSSELVFRQPARRSPAPLRANTRDALHPAPISRGRACPPPSGVGIRASGPPQIHSEGPARLDPTRYGDVPVCNAPLTISESTGDGPQISESSSLGTRAGSFRSHARRWSSPSGLPQVIAILRLPGH